MLLGRWLKRRDWWTAIDDHVILGALPLPADVPKLARLGVRGVVNTCEEYRGPALEYEQHGIKQLRMPTIDFTHPAEVDIDKAIDFIDAHVRADHRVYVHCKAGRGRSATVAICWLMKSKHLSAAKAQTWLSAKRPHVNQRLTERPVVRAYEAKLGLGSD